MLFLVFWDILGDIDSKKILKNLKLRVWYFLNALQLITWKKKKNSQGHG